MRLLPLLLLLGCPKPMPPTLEPARVVQYKTPDGWTNPLRHYPGEGPVVLLVHGMGANHRNWDYREETSIIPVLQEEGYDIWVPGLRGDPGSVAPSRRAEVSYTFDEHARFDMPTAVNTVLYETGADDLLWVGHSMGGMLLYTAVTHYPEKVRAGVAISSPGVFQHPIPVHKLARHGRWLVSGRGMIPARSLGRFALGLGMRRMLEKQVASPDSMRGDLLRGMATHVLAPIPKPMAHQAIGWLQAGELVDLDGTPWIGNSDVPLLLMCGPDDGVVSERDVAATCERFDDCTYVQLSEANGMSHDYGHVDPVVGRMAHVEVFPRVLDFLEDQLQPPPSPWVTEQPPTALD